MEIYITLITAVISCFFVIYLTRKRVGGNLKKILFGLLCIVLIPATLVQIIILLIKGNFIALANLKIWQIGSSYR